MSHACERLVHADMPRTGTVYTSKVILRKGRLPRAVVRSQDAAALHLPAWWLRLHGWGESRSIFATVRDPYTWLPSWYAWCVRNAPEALARIGRGSIAWADVLEVHPKRLQRLERGDFLGTDLFLRVLDELDVDLAFVPREKP